MPWGVGSGQGESKPGQNTLILPSFQKLLFQLGHISVHLWTRGSELPKKLTNTCCWDASFAADSTSESSGKT